MKRLERFTPYALALLRIITVLLFMQHGLIGGDIFVAPDPTALEEELKTRGLLAR